MPGRSRGSLLPFSGGEGCFNLNKDRAAITLCFVEAYGFQAQQYFIVGDLQRFFQHRNTLAHTILPGLEASLELDLSQDAVFAHVSISLRCGVSGLELSEFLGNALAVIGGTFQGLMS